MEQALRTRTRNPEVNDRRAAIALLQPVAAEIARWQISIARLIEIGERSRISREYNSAAAAEASALDQLVADRRHALNNDLQHTTPEIRRHGRVQDCLKALDSVAIGASRAKFLLDLGNDAREP